MVKHPNPYKINWVNDANSILVKRRCLINFLLGKTYVDEGHPIAFFSEKLNETRRQYLAYDMEFYALIQTLKHWRPYLIHREFILYTDHDSLKH